MDKVAEGEKKVNEVQPTCSELSQPLLVSELGKHMVDNFKLIYGIPLTTKLGTYFDVEEAKKVSKKFFNKGVKE
jgi:hypothetical protein